MNTATGASLLPLLEPWVQSLASRSKHTARSYHECVGRFLDAVGSEPIEPQTVGRYLADLDQAGLAPASRAHHVSAVRSFLRFAQRQGAVDTGPLDLLVRPRVAITSMNRYLDEAELRRLLAAARTLGPRHAAVCALLALTGLRVAEAADAEWRHLFRDPDGRLGLLVLGKGGKERVVKVPDALLAILAERHGSDRLDARDRSPLLSDARGSRYTANGLWRLVRASVEAAGIDKPASPHWLRHSFATLAARGGASAFTVQASLGHARLETAQRYVHWARGLADQAVDHLPDLLEVPA